MFLFLLLLAPEACAQPRQRSPVLPPHRIAVVEAPSAAVDTLTVQVAAQLRERLTKSTADNSFRVVSKKDVDGSFTIEHPAKLSPGDYQAIAFYTRSTVLAVTASKQREVVLIRSSLFTAKDSIGRAMPEVTAATARGAVDRLAEQLDRSPGSLFPSP